MTALITFGDGALFSDGAGFTFRRPQLFNIGRQVRVFSSPSRVGEYERERSFLDHGSTPRGVTSCSRPPTAAAARSTCGSAPSGRGHRLVRRDRVRQPHAPLALVARSLLGRARDDGLGGGHVRSAPRSEGPVRAGRDVRPAVGEPPGEPCGTALGSASGGGCWCAGPGASLADGGARPGLARISHSERARWQCSRWNGTGGVPGAGGSTTGDEGRMQVARRRPQRG